MRIEERQIERLIFAQFLNNPRFTQDSPVYPDVWLKYFENISRLDEFRLDLILTPHRKSSAAELYQILSERLTDISAPFSPEAWEMASNGDSVVAKLTFRELVEIALPLTNWWNYYLWDERGEPTEDQRWFTRLVGAFIYAKDRTLRSDEQDDLNNLLEGFEALYRDIYFNLRQRNEPGAVPLWSVSRNRDAFVTIESSVPCTKADAGRRLFAINGSEIAWAVLDTGVDARHPAFRKIDPTTKKPYDNALGSKEDKYSNHTRVVATYDFTKFREILAKMSPVSNPTQVMDNPALVATTSDKNDISIPVPQTHDMLREISRDLKSGRLLDWTVIAPLLRVPHNTEEYVAPKHKHGTHVAGIIGASVEPEKGKTLIGMCPGIELYDIRVLDALGRGDEFNILAGIQFVRWMNNQKDGIVIHGANMSFSMMHEVASYACGQTPVCEACSKLVSDGAVVVAAAGNQGQSVFQSRDGILSQGFRAVNITDPGNAEAVITVGATHRSRPHSYGVSYFSSKGPTGDGRMKPDLVAPGEKIVSTGFNNATERMDGTSMAAPHVSGAAALLLAKHRELIGRPNKVKEILCRTATDLGRDKYFQGCGMVDVLRAIQSV